MEMSGIMRGLALTTLSVLLVTPAFLGQQTGAPPPTQQEQAKPDPHAADEVAAEKQALGFLQYLDQGRYADSYSYTSRLIRSNLSRSAFAQEIGKDRDQQGAKANRKLLNVSYTTTLKGAPAGRYVVIQYATDFANKKDQVETLTMSYENGYWRVAGWHVEPVPPPPTQPEGQAPGAPGAPPEQPNQAPPDQQNQAPPQ